MARTQNTQVEVEVALPASATSGVAIGNIIATSGEHAQHFSNGFQFGWKAGRRDSGARVDAVKVALAAKYNL